MKLFCKTAREECGLGIHRKTSVVTSSLRNIYRITHTYHTHVSMPHILDVFLSGCMSCCKYPWLLMRLKYEILHKVFLLMKIWNKYLFLATRNKYQIWYTAWSISTDENTSPWPGESNIKYSKLHEVFLLMKIWKNTSPWPRAEKYSMSGTSASLMLLQATGGPTWVSHYSQQCFPLPFRHLCWLLMLSGKCHLSRERILWNLLMLS